MLSFCQAHPILSFIQLASAIGPDVPPILIVSMLREDAISSNEWDYFVKTVFVRSLTENFPMGWMTGDNPEFQRTGVSGGWCASLGIDYYEPAGGMRDRIRAPEFILVGWSPSGVGDQVVTKLFAELKYPALKMD